MNFGENIEKIKKNSRTPVFLPAILEKNQADSAFVDFFGAVCLFDSGIGGLSVLFRCRQLLPNEKFIYYGDNARAPYGNLPAEAIKDYVFSAAEELNIFQPKALVLACNTATACCIDSLRKKYSFPILGAYPPVLKAGECGGDGLVLVTRATYRSAAFSALIDQAQVMFLNARFYAYPCDSLAEKIEDTSACAADEFYTADLPRGKFSFVVLGCTHYAHVRGAIERYYGCPVYDGAEGLSKRLALMISEQTAQTKNKNAPKHFDLPPESFAANGSSDKISDNVADCKLCNTTIFNHFSIAVSNGEKEFSFQDEEKNSGGREPSGDPLYVSSDGKVLFVGSGSEKNRSFYEHTFAEKMS